MTTTDPATADATPDDQVTGGSEASLPFERIADAADAAGAPGVERHARRLGRLARSYDTSGERPLVGYAVLLAGYAVLAALVTALVLRRRERLPLPASDVALGAVAVFRVTRLLTKDAVTSALRAPWTVYDGPADPGEVSERPRRGPVRHAVGELVTCPFCLGQWVAAVWLGAAATAPRATRTAAQVLAVATASDVLQHVHVRVTRMTD